MSVLIAVFLVTLFHSSFSQSLCDKYSNPDLPSQTAFITSIVSGVFNIITTQLPNPDVRYFNGAYPHFLPISTDFTSNKSATKLNTLVNNLVAFFGGNQGLGCSSFPNTNFNLADIHKNMYVNAEAQQFFIDAVVSVAARANINAIDQATIRSVLNGATPSIVRDTACSSFATYNRGYVNESDFMLKTVTAFAGRVTTPFTFTKRYFDGRQPSGSTDFTKGGAPLTTHLDHVYKYFGGPGFASCLGSDFPDYTFQLDNKIIHGNMGITDVVFDQWVKFHVETVSSQTGLTVAALADYKAVLNSFRGDVVTAQSSICDKYTAALNLPTTNALVTTVVSGTITALLRNGITAPYFTGQLPSGSIDFTNPANAARSTKLQSDLVAFFGFALGCTDDTIPAYTGQSMQIVHSAMGITDTVFTTFNNLLLGVMSSAGVTPADITAVNSSLETFRSAIVTSSTQTSAAICNKYSNALKVTNLQLLTTVVGETVTAVVGNEVTLPYFNGQKPPGTTNFLDAANAAKLTNLQTLLVQFFGGALGCTDRTIQPYAGADIKTVHANMGVTPRAFETFNALLLNVLAINGVTSDDVNAVGALLESTRTVIVSPYNSDTFAPYYLSAGAIVGIIFGTLILAALFAGMCAFLAMNEKSIPKFH